VYELSEKSAKRIPCFRRANFACSDWSNLYLCTNINEAVNIFYNVLNEVFDTCVHTYYPKISNQPPLYKKFRASGSQAAFSRYLSARSDFTVPNAQSYKNCLARINTQFALDPKQFYNFVNTKRQSYPSSLKFENSAANTDQAIADLFAQFFQTTI